MPINPKVKDIVIGRGEARNILAKANGNVRSRK